MTEKIDGQGVRPTDMTGSTRRPEKTEAGGNASSSTGNISSSEDTVNVSRSSVLLSELQQVVSALPVVDAERVDKLREAIASGTYTIDSNSVADRMIRLERELS